MDRSPVAKEIDDANLIFSSSSEDENYKGVNETKNHLSLSYFLKVISWCRDTKFYCAITMMFAFIVLEDGIYCQFCSACPQHNHKTNQPHDGSFITKGAKPSRKEKLERHLRSNRHKNSEKQYRDRLQMNLCTPQFGSSDYFYRREKKENEVILSGPKPLLNMGDYLRSLSYKQYNLACRFFETLWCCLESVPGKKLLALQLLFSFINTDNIIITTLQSCLVSSYVFYVILNHVAKSKILSELKFCNLHLAEKKELTSPPQNHTNNLRPTRLSAGNKETKIFY
jgi:hypothetical protein